MKKIILFTACALLCAGTALSQNYKHAIGLRAGGSNAALTYKQHLNAGNAFEVMAWFGFYEASSFSAAGLYEWTQPVINNDLTLLTASFGMRIHPFYKSLSQHNGVDFTLPEGSRVFATADGTVTEATRRNSSTGLTVTIDHGNGYQTRYGHLSKTSVKRGQKVNRGDIIALSGNSGLSLAPHLHYEVIYNGQPVDPVNYFFMELSPAEYHRLIRIAQSGMQSFD